MAETAAKGQPETELHIELLLIRHAEDVNSDSSSPISCSDEVIQSAPSCSEQRSKLTHKGLSAASIFSDDPLQPSPRDPVLTDRGLRSLTEGLTDRERVEAGVSNQGVPNGLREVVRIFEPDTLYTSPLRRALATAAVIAPVGITGIAEAGLTELQFDKQGRAKPSSHGHSLQELQRSVQSWGDDLGNKLDLSHLPDVSGQGDWYVPGETRDAAKERIAQFFRHVVSKSSIGQRVVIVTHGGVLKRLPFVSEIMATKKQFYLPHAQATLARLNRDGKIEIIESVDQCHLWK